MTTVFSPARHRAALTLASAIVLFLGACVAAVPATGQELDPGRTPPVWLVPHGDTVRVQVALVPPAFRGFHVERSAAGGEWERITTEPVTPRRDPVDFLTELGSDVPRLRVRTRTDSDAALVRRLRAPGLAGTFYSLLVPSVARALGRSFDDPGVTAGGTYRYRVVFVDGAGAETGETREGSVTVSPSEVAAPTGVTVTPPEEGAAGPVVSWSYPEYRGDPSDVVMGFHVYRVAGDGEANEGRRMTLIPVARDDVNGLRWRDTATVVGERYNYAVRPVDLLGRPGPLSSPTQYTAVSGAPLAPPASLRTEPGESTVRLAWAASRSDGVAGYRIQRTTGPDVPFEDVSGVLPAGDTTWVDEAVAGGVTYTYRMVSERTSGSSSRPGPLAQATPLDTTPPPPVQVLAGSVVDRSIQVNWTPPEDPGLAGYHVYVGAVDGPMVRATSSLRPDPGYRIDGPGGAGLVPGETYRIRVTAQDLVGNESEWAEVTVALPDDVPPGPPSSVTAESPRGREVTLTFNPSPALDVAFYRVTRTRTDAGSPTGGNAVRVLADSLPAQGRRLVRDGDVESGRSYRYAVVAVDRAGNRSEATVHEVRVADAEPPPAPNFVQAAVRPGGVLVAWERVLAEDLAGYAVERSRTPTGPWAPVSDPVSSDVLQLTDIDGSAGLFYRVRARDRSGNESLPSAPARAGGAP